MVDMGVGQEHRFDGIRRDGQRDVLEDVLPCSMPQSTR